jgi:hypothetical protein
MTSLYYVYIHLYTLIFLPENVDIVGGPVEPLLFGNVGVKMNGFPSLAFPRAGVVVAWWHYNIFNEECRFFASIWRSTGTTDRYILVNRTELRGAVVGEIVSCL